MKTKILASISGLLVSLITPLAILVPQVSAAVVTWDGEGADNNFSTAANWSGDTLPVDGDSLTFDLSLLSGSNEVLNNDLNLNLSGISVTNSSSYTYVIQGNDLLVGGVFDSGVTGARLSLSLNIILSANSTVNGSGNLSIGDGGGSLDVSSYSITVNSGYLDIDGSFEGIGSVYVSGGFVSTSNNVGSYAGDIIINGGKFTLYNGVISDTSSITVSDGELVLVGTIQNATFDMSITLGTSDSNSTTLSTEMGLGTYPVTLTGGVVLTSNINVLIGEDLTINEPFTPGSYEISLKGGSVGTLNLPGGESVVSTDKTTTIEANDKTSDLIVASDKETIILKGERGSATINSGGTLKGTGTITGNVLIASGGILAPGLSPGCISSGNLTLAGTYQVEIAGTTVCTEYDQTVVTGTVDVTGGTLQVLPFLNGYKPVDNTAFMIINNDAADAVVGTFAGLVDGATFTVDGYTMQINYNGGDGNDVMLLVTEVPAVPDTGVGSILTSPLMALSATIAALTVIGGLKFADKRLK